MSLLDLLCFRNNSAERKRVVDLLQEFYGDQIEIIDASQGHRHDQRIWIWVDENSDNPIKTKFEFAKLMVQNGFLQASLLTSMQIHDYKRNVAYSRGGHYKEIIDESDNYLVERGRVRPKPSLMEIRERC